MGDVRFEAPFQRVRDAQDRASAVRALSDEDVVAALAGAHDDALLVNILATEAANRIRRATNISRVIGEGVLLTSREGQIRYANPAAEHLLDIPSSRLRGLEAHDVLHAMPGACGGGERCPLRTHLERAGGEAASTHQIVGPEGKSREVSIAVYPVDEEGTSDARVVTIRDVSDVTRTAELLRNRVELLEGAMKRSLDEIEQRRRVERELRESERKLAEIVGTIGEGIVILDTNGRIVFYNRAAERIMGVRAEDVLNRSFRETRAWAALVGTGDAGRLETAFERLAARGERLDLELVVPLADGRRRALAVDAVPLRDAEGVITGVLGSVADVTERKAAEAKLVEINRDLERRVAERTRELESTNAELETFMRAATHDLKAPLRGMGALAEALVEDYGPRLEADGRELVAKLRREARRAMQLVDDLLALARIGREEMRRADVDVSRLATETVDRLRGWEPHRTVDVTIAPDLRAQGDPAHVATVLDNLIGNAWKYTSRRPDARIEVGALRGEPGAFFVRDNGVGFDQAQAPLLFQPFRRLRSAVGFEGTGVGLATVARIIERHGGRVWAEGRLGEGATFYFTLPPPSAPEAAPRVA